MSSGLIRWSGLAAMLGGVLGAVLSPLSQLEVVDADDETREAVEDWLYWTKKGYQF